VPRVVITDGGRPRTSLGCLGSVVGILLVVLLAAALAVGAVILLVVVGALLAVGLVALAVDRILLAVSPSRRARRDAVRAGGVIDVTARVEHPDDDRPPGGRRELPGSGPEDRRG
jgi:uncharacterized protein (DUF58 family)